MKLTRNASDISVTLVALSAAAVRPVVGVYTNGIVNARIVYIAWPLACMIDASLG